MKWPGLVSGVLVLVALIVCAAPAAAEDEGRDAQQFDLRTFQWKPLIPADRIIADEVLEKLKEAVKTFDPSQSPAFLERQRYRVTLPRDSGIAVTSMGVAVIGHARESCVLYLAGTKASAVGPISRIVTVREGDLSAKELLPLYIDFIRSQGATASRGSTFTDVKVNGVYAVEYGDGDLLLFRVKEITPDGVTIEFEF